MALGHLEIIGASPPCGHIQLEYPTQHGARARKQMPKKVANRVRSVRVSAMFKSYSEKILLASRVPKQERLYVVGPFSGRVSFASQQKRAINLIWSIDSELKASGDTEGLKGKKVAIVGAGVAGLTASLAATAFRSTVVVFEAAKKPMNRQTSTGHRDIHPSINAWPFDEIEPSTALPFLNWYQAACNEVTVQIQKRWERIRKRDQNSNLKRILYECRIDELVYVSKKWQVISNSCVSDRYRKNEKYDVLVLATGFGLETTSTEFDSPSYWDGTNDLIEKLTDIDGPKCDGYVVSGTGDGGVIEALRLLFRGFRAGGIGPQGGGALANIDVANRIREVETKARRQLFDTVLLNPALSFDDIKSDTSNFLWQGYKSVFDDDLLHETFEDKLKAHRSKIEKVILTGRQESPLSIDASPYHKLLITYAISQGWVEYVQVASTDDFAICTSSSSFDDGKFPDLSLKRKAMTLLPVSRTAIDKNGLLVKHARKRPIKLTGCFFIARHGYETPLKTIKGLAKGVDADVLLAAVKRSQILFEENDRITAAQAHFFAEGLGGVPMEDGKNWCELCEADANDFFSPLGIHAVVRSSEVAPTEIKAKINEASSLVKGSYIELQWSADRNEGTDKQYEASIIPGKFFGAIVDTTELKPIPARTTVE